MFNPANETHFSLKVEDYVGDLQVLSFTGTEGISQPFRFDLELVSENPDLDLEKLLHKQAFLAFDPQGSGIHGQIYRVAQGDAGKRDTEIKELVADVAALKKQGNPSAAIARLEQDLVVLKSAQDSQPANSDAPTNKEFDVFRIQTTRNITTLQSQVQNLQQQISAR